MVRSSQKAIALIHRFEGIDHPWIWPGGSSGISIPYGYDLGYEQNFENDWKPYLDESIMAKLRPVLGLKGQRAHAAAPGLRGITIPLQAAEIVFENSVLPREEATTMRVFPGSETLPPDAFGGLVSLVYNRGPLIDKTDRRKEMLQLFQLFRKGPPFDLKAIAALVESMKRLWPHVAGSDGDLWTRRIEEAKLIREA